MNHRTEPYLAQAERWPRAGRDILAQLDAESVVVYQAFRPSIGRFALAHGHFGGDFSLSRMSWIKPNFLWMMAFAREQREHAAAGRWQELRTPEEHVYPVADAATARRLGLATGVERDRSATPGSTVQS